MKQRFDKLSQFVIGWAYTYILIYLVGVIVYPDVPLLEIIVLSLSAYALVSLVYLNNVAGSIFLGLVGTALAGTALLYLFKVSFAAPITRIVDDIVTLWGKIMYNEPHEDAFMSRAALVFIIALSIFAAVLVISLYKRHFSFFIITGLALSMTVFSWYMTGKESRITFGLLCTLTVLSYIRHVYAKKKKLGLVSDQLPLGNLMLFTLPLALIPVIIIGFIPKNDLPIQWPWLDTKIMHAIEYMEQRFSYSNVEYFSLSSTGFNGVSQRLGGPVRPSNTVVMDIKAEKRTYLRGAIYSWYENNSWASSDGNLRDAVIENENQAEIGETRTGWVNIPVEDMFADVTPDDRQLLENLSSGKLESVLYPTYSLEVKYRNMSTRTVFTPLKSVMPVTRWDNTPMSLLENRHGAVISNVRLPSGSTYKLQYVQPMYGEPMLKKALTFSKKGLYKDAIDVLTQKRESLTNANVIDVPVSNVEVQGDANDIRIAKNSSEAGTKSSSQNALTITDINRRIQYLSTLNDRAKAIEGEYTKLNDSISPRIKELAATITKDSKSDYERVVKLQDYLRINYTYTLNARVVPQGKDFVDYFLFEDKNGYCTYYATAMAIMLRTLGIPARYVEGYVLPEEANHDNVYTVSNKNAHAWVEVYFEGFGWMTFEPTTVYKDVMNYRNTAKPTGVYTGSTYEDIEALMKRYRGSDDIPGYVPVKEDASNSKDLSRIISYIPWVLGGLLVLAILVNLFAALIGSLILTRLKSGKKVIRLYESMLKWLLNVGYVIKPGETVREFSARIDKMYYFKENTFREVTEIFSKVRYGQQEVTAEEINAVKRVYKELRRSVLKELGFRRYMPLRRLFLGI